MKGMRTKAFLLGSALTALGISFVGPMARAIPCAEQHIVHEQTQFSAEDESFKHPCDLPQEALNILRNDPRASAELSVLRPNQSPSALLTATTVHLHSPLQNDIVVMGVGTLRGANVSRFWIFVQTPLGLHLAVSGAPALDLTIMNTQTNGYHNIELGSATAVSWSETVLHFDGKEYQRYSTRTHRN